MSELSRTEPWYRQRYLGEHWGRTMAAQQAIILDEYGEALTEAIKDLLANERFGPRTVLDAVASVASDQKDWASRHATEARKLRQARLREYGGCPVCADAANPDPTACRWHARYLGAETKDEGAG